MRFLPPPHGIDRLIDASLVSCFRGSRRAREICLIALRKSSVEPNSIQSIATTIRPVKLCRHANSFFLTPHLVVIPASNKSAILADSG